jgi:hypothetical protein
MATKKKVAKKKATTRTFKDWYAENKKKLNAAKKKRYENDPAYKKAAKERVHQKYREEKGIFEDGSRIVYLDGEQYLAYKLSDASDFLGININTLRGYFQREYLPLIYFDDSRLKLVTVDQLPLIQRFLTAMETLPAREAAKKTAKYIGNHWRDRNASKKAINQNKKG